MEKKPDSKRAREPVFLGVHPPADISLAIEGAPDRAGARLVGVNPGVYLIVTAPTMGDLPKGSDLDARYLREGAIWGFQTTVLSALKAPFPLVFLSYPKSVKRHELRQKERSKCYIPAKVVFMNDGYDVVISDINAGGCRFTYRGLPTDEKGARPDERLRLMIGDEMTFFFRVPGGPEDRSCLGRVRNFARHTEKIIVGTQFVSMPQELNSEIKKYMEQVKLV